MKLTLTEAAPHLQNLKREPMIDLAAIVQSEITSPQAFAALAVLYHRATRREIIDYRQYIQSAKWRRVRARKLEEADHQCGLCLNTRNLHVHHRTYERLGHERLEDLVVLCNKCHSRHHGVLK